MKFTLTLLNDDDKIIKNYSLKTWYGDEGLKKEIHDNNGIEILNTMAGMLSLSLQQEMDDAVKTLLFVMQEKEPL